MLPIDLFNHPQTTPLVELQNITPKPGVRLFAKLEGQNPSGSIKDRVVHAIIRDAESRGTIRPGDTIIEASSGNTAIALAMVAKQKGYTAHVILPEGVVPSVVDLLNLYGARITWCEPQAGLKGAIEIARQMAEEFGYYPLSQFSSSVNIETHYNTTGQEIVEALPSVDVFVAGIGTGGTIMGVGKRLRESHPNALIVGVEPQMGERLQGLRSLSEGFIPPLLDLKKIDSRFIVDNANALKTVRLIAEAEGIFPGVSSGATLYAAMRIAQRIDHGNIVMMFADSGWKYLPSRPWGGKESDSSLDDVHWW